MSLLKYLYIFGLSFSFILLQGCAYLAPFTPSLTQGTIIKQAQVDLLQPGLTRGQVQALLGPAFGENPFNPRHWEYVFYTTDPDFHPDAISHIVIKFDDYGYLESWQIMDKVIELKEEGFFSKL